MKKITIIIFVLTAAISSRAQTGINTTSPAVSSVVEVSSANKGVLLPRVALTSINDMVTIASPANSLTVFNTSTAGTVPDNVLPGYYYWSVAATKWVRLLDITDPNVNIYNVDGSLSGNRIVTQGTNTLAFTASAINAFSVNNSTFSVDAANHRIGIGTIAPTAKLEIASGVTNTSGLKFTNFSSTSPIGVGQTLGVDAGGAVITMPNAAASTVTTKTVSISGGASYNVDESAYVTIPNTSQTVAIPANGRALFVSFMLGIDFYNNPAGSGYGYYDACIFIDGVETKFYLTIQEPGQGGLQTQYSLSFVKFLLAGNHTVDVRMKRMANNGTAALAAMNFGPISMVFNATFIN